MSGITFLIREDGDPKLFLVPSLVVGRNILEESEDYVFVALVWLKWSFEVFYIF